MAVVFSATVPVLASDTVTAVGDASAGEAQAAVCAGCHGADGNSPAPSFPKIANLGEKYLFKQLQDIQSNARPVVEMTGLLDGKSEQDLRDLAAYYDGQVLQLSGASPQEVRVNAGIKVDGLVLGERIFRAGNLQTAVPACSGCHSPRGLGNGPAAYPRLGGQYADYIAKQLRAFRSGERTNDGDAQIMRQVAAQMSDAEIDAVANYISGLQ
ncbi:MAG: cytochrome c4 [Cellvibrionaceae bacterium]|nr:cytochrome c4 [Cellvibrionaceae bacterium]